jgi:hypothetical protein
VTGHVQTSIASSPPGVVPASNGAGPAAVPPPLRPGRYDPLLVWRLPAVTAFWYPGFLPANAFTVTAGGFAYTVGDRAGRIVNVEALAGRHATVEAGLPEGPLLWHTNHGRYLPGADPSPEGTTMARGQTLSELPVPEQDPGPAWFLRILAGAPLPHGVRRDHEDGDPAITLCTFVADLTAGEAVIAARDEQAVAIPLRDLAEDHPLRQR